MKTIINSKGKSISYEFISTNRIRITTQNTLYHTSVRNGEILMFDFDGGPVLTKNVIPPIDGCNQPIAKMEQMSNDYGLVELIIHLI